MSGHVNDGMDEGSMMESESRIEKIVDIYMSAEAVRGMKHKKDTSHSDTQTLETQTPQHTGSDSARVRSFRVASVCLVLLYFLLLTAVIVLCVHIYTSNTNYTQERNQQLTRITNLTEEKQQLLTRNTNLTEERDELLTRNTNLTEERDELLTRNTNLTEERNNLTIKTINLSIERNQLKIKSENLTNARNQLNNTLQIVDGWIYYQSSFYYVSNNTGKNWTESRRDCQQRGADLIIINNRQEQDFIMNFTLGKECWIGLTDSDVEGRWKWVDGTSMTFGMWAFKEPNGGPAENCVVTYLTRANWLLGWIDEKCDRSYQWICEKNISHLIQP